VIASELFRAIDRLSYPQRQRTLAAYARQVAGRPEFGTLLAELRQGDSFAREMALFLAIVARDAAALQPFLADPDHLIRARAIKAWLTFGQPTPAALAELLSDAPAQTRVMIFRQLRVRRATELADAIIDGVADRFGAVEAGRVLAACGSETVARYLPMFSTSVNWKRLAVSHPDAVLAEADRQLRMLPESTRTPWWRRFGDGVFAAVPTRPGEVIDLMERYSPATTLPYDPAVYVRLGSAYPDRIVDLLTAPRRAAALSRMRLSRGLARVLTTVDSDRIVVLARRLRDQNEEEKIGALLAAMAPSRREAIYDAIYADADRSRAILPDQILDALPHQRRAAEARRMLTVDEIRDRAAYVIHYQGFLPWAEVRDRLVSPLRLPLADERSGAYVALVQCARRSADPAVVTEAVSILTGLRNEQDPVRSRALAALAEVPGRLFSAAAADRLTTVVTDALAARDVSHMTRSAIQNLAVSVFQAQPTDPALAQWALRTLESAFGDDRMPALGRLDLRLRRGQEVRAFAAVRDWIEAGTQRGKYTLLFSFTRSLGRRAYALDALQDMLREAIRGGAPSTVVRQAIQLWLDDPATRAARVEEVLRRDTSTIALDPVWSIVDGQRTDLLDLVFGRKSPSGPFLAKGVRWVPGYSRHVRRWLPRQRTRYAELLETVAKDAGASVNNRVSAIRAAAEIPDGGFAAVARWVDSPNIALAEAALAALPRTDRPAEALPHLLGHTGDDRARVAVYAARRAARFLPPSHLGDVLTVQLAGSLKVTSRKELLRLAADFGVPQAGPLLLADWSRPDGHTDVRAAIVGTSRQHRELAAAWDILTEAATSGEYAVALTLLMADPLSLPEPDRIRYGTLVVATLGSADHQIADYAWSKAPAWVSWAPGMDEAVLTALTNIDGRTLWNRVADTLAAVVRAGSVSIVDRLLRALVALDEADRGDDPSQDRSALRRLISVSSRLADAVSSAGTLDRSALADAARYLAGYDPAAGQAPFLRLAAIPADASAPELAQAIDEVAGLLADRPVAAAQVALDLYRMAARNGWGAMEIAEIADVLLRRSDAAGGLLTLGLAEQGRDLGWPEPYRGLVLRLRQHPDADVRSKAYTTSLTSS
jgi:hypothetical protein